MSEEMIVARALDDAGIGEEPVMPGLSAHFPEMEYHGAAQYTVKCDCGFQTRKPENYYLTKARWADHAALSAYNPNERLREALEALFDLEAPAEHLPEPMSSNLLAVIDKVRSTLPQVSIPSPTRQG